MDKVPKAWIGDVPNFRYCVDKVRNLGWRPKLGSSRGDMPCGAQIAEQEAGKFETGGDSAGGKGTRPARTVGRSSETTGRYMRQAAA